MRMQTDKLRDELIKDHWLFNYSWRGVKLAVLEKQYGVLRADILSMMRDIANKYDPPNAPQNGFSLPVLWDANSLGKNLKRRKCTP